MLYPVMQVMLQEEYTCPPNVALVQQQQHISL